MPTKILFFILAPLLLLTGCASNDASVLSPEEFSKTMLVKQRARVLRPGDEVLLAVEVNGKKEVPMTTIKVDYAGALAAPLVGDVVVDGLALAAARQELQTHYARIFVGAPMITFQLDDNDVAGEWGYITVLGQVRSPGRFPVQSIAGMNLSDSLHEAGGFGDSANINEVVITRETAAGRLVQCLCDIKEFGTVGSAQRDLVLFDGDVVYVPERLF